ncbi:MAG: HAMP domain-containing sensor histidine kinase [Bacteroidota bacterium]
MKLLNKTGRYYLLGLVGVMLVGGIIFYFLLIRSLNHFETENLLNSKDLVIDKLNKMPTQNADLIVLEGNLEILNNHYEGKNIQILRDTISFDKRENEIIPMRTLTFSFQNQQNHYLIRLSKSLIERDELREVIGRFIIILLGLFVMVLFWLNRIISRSVWMPFYEILIKTKGFKVTQNQPLTFTKINISEFDDLQNVLQDLTKQISTDYHALKEFTENASHEIQTPLAIIRSKLENLIQSENLQEGDMKTIQTVYEAAGRLSKLNQSLLLLTKIDNQQFVKHEQINIFQKIESQLINYEDFILGKKISVTKELNKTVELEINPTLLDILLSNLLMNAIKHNVKNGTILIMLSHEKLVIQNTGKSLENTPNMFFGRFIKHNTESESLGLGLAIVKKICETNHLKIDYLYLNNIHSIEILL